MTDLNFLKNVFRESSSIDLSEIFECASQSTTQAERIELNRQLLSVLRQERSIGLAMWNISPSGDNHIVVTDNRCLFINIYGVRQLVYSCLFSEGELYVKNINWIEEDNLVLFDLFYIVRSKFEKCICHYSNNSNAFFYSTAIQKCDTGAIIP